MNTKRISCTFVILIVISFYVYAQTVVSPFQYGWLEADSDKARYKVLYETHTAAVEQGAQVDYCGIDTANIELYYGCRLIPLTDYNDFKGLVINVKNNVRNDYIFSHAEPSTPVTLNKESIDKGTFNGVNELQNGDYLLCIKDTNVWGKREGYSDPVIRCDIIYVKNGRGKTRAILPYNNEWSAPECTYTPVKNKPFVIKNLTINRKSSDSLYKTMAINLKNLYDVRLDCITINTEKDSLLFGDQAIRITNCMNVTMKNIRLNGSYSQENKWGYGISLYNVADFKTKNLYGHAKWGIFGNNNVNGAVLEDCDINRWDIHHYGKDVILRHCKISNQYNQYSSIYGTVTYDCCHFINCIPHLIDSSYNAYPEYNIVFRDCIIDVNNKDARMFLFNRDDSKVNPRHEMSKKYWPNVSIEKLTVKYNINNPMSVFVKKMRFTNDSHIDTSILNMVYSK